MTHATRLRPAAHGGGESEKGKRKQRGAKGALVWPKYGAINDRDADRRFAARSCQPSPSRRARDGLEDGDRSDDESRLATALLISSCDPLPG